MFSLESPHRGDSNVYTQQTVITIKKKITINYPKYDNVCSYGISFLGTQKRVRNSRSKRAIRDRATEVLLYCMKRIVFLLVSCVSDIFSFDLVGAVCGLSVCIRLEEPC